METRVLICGTHAAHWMAALAADAPVWRLLPEVVEVGVLAQPHGGVVPPSPVPMRQTVLLPLMENHTKQCPRGGRALIPSPAMIDVLAGKGAFAQYIAAFGLARYCPISYRHIDDVRYPCVAKRVDLFAGDGIAIVPDAAALTALRQHPLWHGHEVLIQELVPGTVEHVTHCVCKDGEILWHTTFAYDMGEATRVRTATNMRAVRAEPTSPAALTAIAEILRPLRYNGPCNADYKLVTPERALVLEINPRLGGSLMLPQNVAALAACLRCLIAYAEPRF